MEYGEKGQVDSVLKPGEQVDCCQLVKSLFNDALTYYSDYHTAMMEELDLSLSLHHYVDDQGNVKDRRFVQPHTLDLYHLLRHKWSQIDSTEVYLDVQPVDNYSDVDLAEDCKFALEHVVNDRRLRYMAARRRMIVGALSARAWGMKVEFDASIRPYGDLVFSSVNPCDLFMAPGWVDMHDATCPWVGERTKMRLNDVLAMSEHGWDVSGISATGTMSKGRVTTDNGVVPGQVRLSRRGAPTTGTSNQDTVTILKWWFRNDPYEETYQAPGKTVELEHDEQYYECPACKHVEDDKGPEEGPGYQEEPGEYGQAPKPEWGQVCPQCGQDNMRLVTSVDQETSFLKYPDGRLIIVCPELDQVLYDGKWPVKLRSFPYMLYRAYPHPEDPYGQSDVSLLWTMVLIQDATFRAGWEQMIRNTDVIMTPRNGLEDANGDPFMFTDDQGSVAYFTDPMAASLTKHFQGSGLSPGWSTFLSSIQQSFQKNMGFNDVSMSPSQLSNAAVGAVQASVQQGEIPIQDHVNQLNDEQTMFLGVVLDYIIGTWTEERFIRYSGFDGIPRVKRILGSDLPYADVEVSAQPKLNPVDTQAINAFTQWLGFDPPARMVMAQLLNLPPSLVRKYEQAKMEFMQQQMMASVGPMGGPPPPGDGAAPMPPPGGMPGPQGPM